MNLVFVIRRLGFAATSYLWFPDVRNFGFSAFCTYYSPEVRISELRKHEGIVIFGNPEIIKSGFPEIVISGLSEIQILETRDSTNPAVQICEGGGLRPPCFCASIIVYFPQLPHLTQRDGPHQLQQEPMQWSPSLEQNVHSLHQCKHWRYAGMLPTPMVYTI